MLRNVLTMLCLRSFHIYMFIAFANSCTLAKQGHVLKAHFKPNTISINCDEENYAQHV